MNYDRGGLSPIIKRQQPLGSRQDFNRRGRGKLISAAVMTNRHREGLGNEIENRNAGMIVGVCWCVGSIQGWRNVNA